jgi:hypothetical protein
MAQRHVTPCRILPRQHRRRSLLLHRIWHGAWSPRPRCQASLCRATDLSMARLNDEIRHLTHKPSSFSFHSLMCKPIGTALTCTLRASLDLGSGVKNCSTHLLNMNTHSSRLRVQSRKVSTLECSTWPSDFNAEVCSLGNHRYWHRPESGSRPEGPKSPGMTRIVRDCDRYWMQLFFIRVCRVLRDIPAIPTYTGMKLINMV